MQSADTISRCANAVKQPFRRMGGIDRIVRIFRFIFGLLIIFTTSILTIGYLLLPKYFYIGKLSLSPNYIADGLFKILSENFSTMQVNSGLGLSTSGVVILTQYGASKVSNVPNYITYGPYSNCISRIVTKNPQQDIHAGCVQNEAGHAFDYRYVLSSNGLKSVLQYAYLRKELAIHRDVPLPTTDLYDAFAYHSYLTRAKHWTSSMLDILYAIPLLQLFLFCFMLWYYSIKGKKLNNPVERILLRVICTCTLVLFLCSLLAVIALIKVQVSLKERITHELESFRFVYEISPIWFSLLIILVNSSFFSCVFWCGLEGFVMDNSDDDESSRLKPANSRATLHAVISGSVGRPIHSSALSHEDSVKSEILKANESQA